MFKRYQFVLSALSFACLTPAFASIPVDLEHQPVSVLQAFSTNALATQSSLKEVSRHTDFNQTTHVRLKQFYAGVPVFGGDVIVHIKKGQSFALNGGPSSHNLKLNGLIYEDLIKDLGAQPLFSDDHAADALQKAIALQDSGAAISNTKVHLLIYVDDKNTAHWAYFIQYFVTPETGLPKKPTFIMDAKTFKVYESWDDIQTVETVNGGGYGGNEKSSVGKFTYDGLAGDLISLKMTRDSSTKLCFLKNSEVTVEDASKSDAVEQFLCQTPNVEHNNVYWDADKDAVNGAYSPANDALYAGFVVKNMYQDWFHFPVLVDDKGKPMMLIMRVHDPKNPDNAYWDGKQMTFGDGDNMNFYPFVTLDVGGHEISHGFTEQNSGLVYRNQSGGLNESFSDMAGEATKFYSAGTNNWLVGAGITKQLEALRYMDEPTKDCNGNAPGNNCSISNAKDYTWGMNPHYSSGVFNKAFYLLSTSHGWNTKKAFEVMVNANRDWWVPRASFTGAACGVINAATDLRYEVTSIKQAFSQVGVSTSQC